MAIVVLVLWLFTAGAGFYLLATSSLGRTRSAVSATPSPQPAVVAAREAQAAAPSRRAARRAARERWDPPSLVAARQAPILPGVRSVVEFAHPAGGIVGLAFWLGFTLIHNRALGWIAFGLVTLTACLGLTWFAANSRAAKRRPAGEPGPSFSTRLVVLHGGAAAVTFTLAALTVLVLGR